MTREDLEVLIRPMSISGKPAVGSMGDDTPPAAMLDSMPRRLEDHFALRFAQETSPPIDPIRDKWVFDPSVFLGQRSGLWNLAKGHLFSYDSRILSPSEAEWLWSRSEVASVSLLFPASEGVPGLESAISRIIAEAVDKVRDGICVIVLSDRHITSELAAVPILRVASLLHKSMSELGLRSQAGIVADAGVWDIHHCAMLITNGADAVWTNGNHLLNGAFLQVLDIRLRQL